MTVLECPLTRHFFTKAPKHLQCRDKWELHENRHQNTTLQRPPNIYDLEETSYFFSGHPSISGIWNMGPLYRAVKPYIPNLRTSIRDPTLFEYGIQDILGYPCDIPGHSRDILGSRSLESLSDSV